LITGGAVGRLIWINSVPGFHVAAVARAQGLVVRFLKFSLIFAFYGFFQLGDLCSQDRIQDVRDFDAVFFSV
jgi:hypothetical protein